MVTKERNDQATAELRSWLDRGTEEAFADYIWDWRELDTPPILDDPKFMVIAFWWFGEDVVVVVGCPDCCCWRCSSCRSSVLKVLKSFLTMSKNINFERLSVISWIRLVPSSCYLSIFLMSTFSFLRLAISPFISLSYSSSNAIF